MPNLSPADRRQKAIDLVAAGKLSSDAIAKEIGVCRRTVTTWRADKDFQRAVKESKNAWRAKVRTTGPGDRDSRLRDVRSLRNRLWAAMVERGKDPEHQDVPGYKTGCVTVVYKMQSLGEGKGSKAVREYKIDSETPRAIEEALEMAAVERGHRDPKKKDAGAVVPLAEYIEILNAGMLRVAAAKANQLPAHAKHPTTGTA